MRLARVAVTALFVGSSLILGEGLAPPARASNIAITISNLPGDQIDPLYKTLAANFVFTPYEPATAWAETWGLALGVSAAATALAPIQTQFATISTPYIPDADLVGVVALPYGTAIEVGFLPQLTLGGVKLSKIGGDVKWTATELWGHQSLPVDVAVRFMMSQTKISYGETVLGVADTLAFTSRQTGFNIAVSKPLWFANPYVGLGWLSETGTLSDQGQVTLFNTSVTASTSYTSTSSGLWFYGGVQLKLWLLTLTAQYDRTLGSSRLGGKFGFEF